MGPLPNTHVTCHTWHVTHHMSHINIFCSPIQVGCLKVCIQCIPRTIVYVMRIIHWHVGLLWALAGGQWEDRDWHFSLPQLTSEFRSSPCLGSSRLLARKFEIWTEEFFLSDKILFSHDRRCISQYPAINHQQIEAHLVGVQVGLRILPTGFQGWRRQVNLIRKVPSPRREESVWSVWFIPEYRTRIPFQAEMITQRIVMITKYNFNLSDCQIGSAEPGAGTLLLSSSRPHHLTTSPPDLYTLHSVWNSKIIIMTRSNNSIIYQDKRKMHFSVWNVLLLSERLSAEYRAGWAG